MPVKVEFGTTNRAGRRKALSDLRRSGRRIERAIARLQKKSGGRPMLPAGASPEPTEGPTQLDEAPSPEALQRYDAAVKAVLKATAELEDPALD